MKKEQRITHTHPHKTGGHMTVWETTERLLKRQQMSQNVASGEKHRRIKKNNETKIKPSVNPILADSSY